MGSSQRKAAVLRRRRRRLRNEGSRERSRAFPGLPTPVPIRVSVAALENFVVVVVVVAGFREQTLSLASSAASQKQSPGRSEQEAQAKQRSRTSDLSFAPRLFVASEVAQKLVLFLKHSLPGDEQQLVVWLDLLFELKREREQSNAQASYHAEQEMVSRVSELRSYYLYLASLDCLISLLVLFIIRK